MKTKLTLNVDDKIVARAKRESAKRKVSLSSLVEDYLDRFSKNAFAKKNQNTGPSLLEQIRKYTKNPTSLPEDFDYKKALHEHLEEKYGV
jgi:hypothetical protein